MILQVTSTEECRNKQKQSLLAYYKDIDKESDSYKSWCQHISEGKKGYCPSKETRAKLSEISKQRIGKKNGFYGKSHSIETKNSIASKNSLKVKAYNETEVLEFNSIKSVCQCIKTSPETLKRASKNELLLNGYT